MGVSLQQRMMSLDSTTVPLKASEEAMYLLSLLPTQGRIKQVVLAEKMGCKPAHVRKLMRELRRVGFAVCSDNKGCWQTRKPHEIIKTINNLRGRAQSLIKTASAMEKRMRRG